jgi:hypothetical protein
MQPRFDGADLRFGDAGNFFQRKIFNIVQEQDRPMGRGKLVNRTHKFGLLFAANKNIVGGVKGLVRSIRDFIEQKFLAAFFSPVKEAFLVGDAEEPACEFFIVAQSGNVPGGGNERFLDDIQACVLMTDQLEYLDIQWQLVAAKERIPGGRLSFAGLLDGQLFALSHYQHSHKVECTRREKVQTTLPRPSNIIRMPKNAYGCRTAARGARSKKSHD